MMVGIYGIDGREEDGGGRGVNMDTTFHYNRSFDDNSRNNDGYDLNGGPHTASIRIRYLTNNKH